MDEYTMSWSDAAREEATASALEDGTWAPARTARQVPPSAARLLGASATRDWLRRLQAGTSGRGGAAARALERRAA